MNIVRDNLFGSAGINRFQIESAPITHTWLGSYLHLLNADYLQALGDFSLVSEYRITNGSPAEPLKRKSEMAQIASEIHVDRSRFLIVEIALGFSHICQNEDCNLLGFAPYSRFSHFAPND